MELLSVYQPNLPGMIHYVGQMLLPISSKMPLVVFLTLGGWDITHATPMTSGKLMVKTQRWN